MTAEHPHTGGFAARIFAALVDLVGLPKTGNISGARKNVLYRKIKEETLSGDLWKREKLLEVRDGYECLYFLFPFNTVNCLLTFMQSITK
jgi:hypothetical protein